jgi:hypothetical protein
MATVLCVNTNSSFVALSAVWFVSVSVWSVRSAGVCCFVLCRSLGGGAGMMEVISLMGPLDAALFVRK